MVYFYGQITEPIFCTLKYLLTACIWQRLFQFGSCERRRYQSCTGVALMVILKGIRYSDTVMPRTVSRGESKAYAARHCSHWQGYEH